MKGYLKLDNGKIFEGYLLGYQKNIYSEIVFNISEIVIFIGKYFHYLQDHHNHGPPNT